MSIELLLGIVVGVPVLLVLILLVFYLAKSGQRVEIRDVEVAISRIWQDSRLDEKLGEITTHARDIRNSHTSIEQMLRVPKERASLGEIGLEAILTDPLPPDLVHIRSRMFGGKIPDAAIESSVGLICIDSKFPLDNYIKMQEATDPVDGNGHKSQFIKDVRGHLNKVAEDYVRPDQGSAAFAFAYIPSEGVYYFLVSEAYQMLREYVGKGVQLVSPLTLSHKIELIKTGVHARKLSDNAAKVEKDIQRLAANFKELDAAWNILYGTHWRNAANKAEELDQGYRRLREEFERIRSLSE